MGRPCICGAAHGVDLLEINRLITSSLDPCVVLEVVTKEATRLMHGDAAALLLAQGDTLRVSVTHALSGIHGVELALGTDVMPAIRDIGKKLGLEGFVGVPLVLRGETIGVLAVYGKEPRTPAEGDEEVLGALADQAAIAFDNARIHHASEVRANALRDSEERFRLAFDEAPIGVALVGLDGRFLRVNNALCEIVGYDSEELIGKTFQSITHPDDLDIDVDLAGKLARGEIPRYQLAKRYLHKDGHSVDVQLSASIVRGADHEPLYYIAQIEDITAEKRDQELLRQTQERYELALRGADLGTWDWNIATGEVVFNARWAEMRGYRLEEIEPHVNTWAKDVHPEDMPAVQRALAEHFEGGAPIYDAEHRVRCKSGDWIWILDRGRVFARDQDGRPTRAVGTELDITARKNAERDRAKLLRQIQTVLAQAPVGILVSLDGRTWQVNDRAHALFGRPSDAPSDVHVYADEILDAHAHPIAFEDLPRMRAMRGEVLQGIELRIRRPDGTLVPVLVNAAPIPHEPSQPAGVVVTYEDITSLKELERLRSEWSSIIAHDLRQPLSSISLSAELAAEQVKDHPAVQKRLAQIREAARRLNQMVQDLLDFSLLEARQLRLQREVRDIAPLVDEVTERMSLEDPQRPILLVVRGPSAFVAVDPDRLQQILENLLSNALKYGEPRTPIHVEVDTDEESVSVSVTNHGEGIAAEHLPNLFARFRTLGEARRIGAKGIGLGLYITRELVEAFGGHITAESTPGETTTFRFVLPLARSTAELEAAHHHG